MIGFTTFKILESFALRQRTTPHAHTPIRTLHRRHHIASLYNPLTLSPSPVSAFPCPVNLNLPPETVGIIDSAYLGLLWLYGQGPRSMQSLLFTGLVYGLPSLLHFFQYDQLAGVVDYLPKYATRVSTAYSVISGLALLLAAIGAVPVLSALFKIPAVQEMVQEAKGKLADGMQGAGAGAGARTRTKTSALDDEDDTSGLKSRRGYTQEQ